MSAERLDGAIALVAETLGRRARLVDWRIEPVELDAPPDERAAERADDDGPVAAEIRDAVLAGFMRDRFRRMLDEPDARFDGLTPREAARSARHRPRVERWLRTLENAATHRATPGEAGPDVAMLRNELGMPDATLADAA
jgi:hypothetical protein